MPLLARPPVSPMDKGVIELGWAEGAQRKGATESCTIKDWEVGACLLAAICLCNLGPSSPIINMSASKFRMWFDQALGVLRLDPSLFRPNSLRRGSASYDVITSQNTGRTFERGRWSDICTARNNANSGRVALADFSLKSGSHGVIGHYSELARM